MADTLHSAAERGQMEGAARMLAEGADVDERDVEGMTALHWAADHGHEQVRCRLPCQRSLAALEGFACSTSLGSRLKNLAWAQHSVRMMQSVPFSWLLRVATSTRIGAVYTFPQSEQPWR